MIKRRLAARNIDMNIKTCVIHQGRSTKYGQWLHDGWTVWDTTGALSPRERLLEQFPSDLARSDVESMVTELGYTVESELDRLARLARMATIRLSERYHELRHQKPKKPPTIDRLEMIRHWNDRSYSPCLNDAFRSAGILIYQKGLIGVRSYIDDNKLFARANGILEALGFVCEKENSDSFTSFQRDENSIDVLVFDDGLGIELSYYGDIYLTEELCSALNANDIHDIEEAKKQFLIYLETKTQEAFIEQNTDYISAMLFEQLQSAPYNLHNASYVWSNIIDRFAKNYGYNIVPENYEQVFQCVFGSLADIPESKRNHRRLRADFDASVLVTGRCGVVLARAIKRALDDLLTSGYIRKAADGYRALSDSEIKAAGLAPLSGEGVHIVDFVLALNNEAQPETVEDDSPRCC